MEFAVILLLAPIAWAALCAAVVLAFAWVLRSSIPTACCLAAAALFGLVAVEFELVLILVGFGYDGQCSANIDIIEKVPRYRPCRLADWRNEKLFPRFFGGVVWYWRSVAAAAFCVTFFVLHYRWRRQEGRET